MAEKVFEEIEPAPEAFNEIDRLGGSMQMDELHMVRFILDPVWPNLPEVCLSELYVYCLEKEDDDTDKVMWHFMAALLASKIKKPGCLCRFVKAKSYKFDSSELLCRLLLAQIALELASNTKSCRAFILHVLITLQVRDKGNYLPNEKDIGKPNDIIPYVLSLFKKAEELDKIGPVCLDPLKSWLEKKDLRKTAQMVSPIHPLVLCYSENGGKYDLTFQKATTIVKQCSEESKEYIPILQNGSVKQIPLDS